MRISQDAMRAARNSLGAGVLLVAGMASLCWASGAYGTSMGPSQFEPYLAMGARHGSEALHRDLNAQHPAGSSLVSLMARLERAGFACSPETTTFSGYDCHVRRALSERRVAVIQARVRSAGVRVVAVEPQLGVMVR